MHANSTLRALTLTTLVSIGFVPVPVWGQGAATATIVGKVVDGSQGVRPGVTVTATSPALQLRQVTAVTDGAGNYQLRDLPAPGVYRVTFEIPGFQTHVRSDLNLPVGFAARVDAVMQVGSVSETLEVSGANPVVDILSPSRTTSLQAEELRTLPKGTMVQELFTMVSGVTLLGTPDVGDSNLGQDAQTRTYGSALLPTVSIGRLSGINSRE